ncbi:MAG: glucoamylase family protein [Clostridia bacterium]
MQAVNNDQSLQFCLLADLQSANEEILADDKDIFAYFQQFRNDKRFCFLVRKRTKNNNKYCGYERKRGAINSLNEALTSGNFDAFCYVSFSPTKPNFVILLDEDSDIVNGGLRLAVNTMLHPLNAKYDLMAFESKYQLSSLRSIFSKKYLFDSGVESYNNYSNFYYNMTGYSIFCGKGIYRLDKYKSKLDGILPENKVLSHDIVEGAILSTGNLGINIFEQAPQSFAVDVERSNRWSRGDILLLPFAKNRFCSQNFYKYVIVSNFLKILSPIFELVLWILLAITGQIQLILPLFFASFAIAFVGVGFDLISVDRNIRPRYVIRFVAEKIFNMIFHLIFLPFFATNALILLAKMLWKGLFQQEKLLDWKTFWQSQQSNGFGKHLALVAPSCVVAVVVFGGLQNIFLLGYCLLFLIMANLIYLAKAPSQRAKKLSWSEKNTLTDIAEKTQEYFCEVMQNDALPSDHIQFYPQKKVCNYTSPTNIGFGLASVICAHKFGTITIEKALDKLDKQVTQIVDLEKWKGNLFNWYNIDTNLPCDNKFVSSVDCGNLLAILIATENFCKQNKAELLAEKVGKLIDESDLNALFDASKSQFYIGYNLATNTLEGHYDMLASEARLLAYIASCRFGNDTPWRSLSRQNVASAGNVLVSWSGTAFEYLMPQIFLPTCRNSLIGNTIDRALKIMSKNKCANLWGISESGYYSFDKEMNYQYHAFGLEQLGLKAQQNKCVIAPYASLLGLEFATKKVLRNIEKMSQNGLLGKYGLFESVDYTNTKKIIYSCMSHHQGMILTAITNMLFDGYFRQLFLSNNRVEGGQLLAEEKANYTRHSRRIFQDFEYESAQTNDYDERVILDGSAPTINALTNGEYSVVTDSFGRGYSKCKNNFINKYKPDLYANYGGFVYFKSNGKLFSPTFAPQKGEYNGFEAQFKPFESVFSNEKEHCKMQIFVPNNENCEVRKVTISNQSDQTHRLEVAFWQQLSLTTYAEENAHQTFSDMFVSTFVDSPSNALVAHRKSRGEHGDCWCGMVVKGLENTLFESNLSNIISQKFGEYSLSIFDKEKVGASVGDVLNPCLGFSSAIELLPNQTLEFAVIIAYSDDFESLQNRLEQIAKTDYVKYAYESAKLQSLSKTYKYLATAQISSKFAALAQNLLFRNYSSLQLHEMWSDKRQLVGGLSKEVKYIFFEYDGNKTKLFEIAHAVAFCNLVGIECDIAIVFREKDEYNELVKKRIVEQSGIEDLDLLPFVKMINANAIADEDFVALKSNAFANCDKDILTLRLNSTPTAKVEKEREYMTLSQSIQYQSGCGGLDGEGNYIVTSSPATVYSNVICGQNGGFVVTQNGGGFSFQGNSYADKLTHWQGDAVIDAPSESIFVCEERHFVRINKLCRGGFVKHTVGYTQFCGGVNKLEFEQTQCNILQGQAKVRKVRLVNHSTNSRKLEIVLQVAPALGAHWTKDKLFDQVINDNIMRVANAYNGHEMFVCATLPLKVVADKGCIHQLNQNEIGEITFVQSDFYNPSHAVVVELKIPPNGEKILYFAMSTQVELLATLSSEKIEQLIEIDKNYFKNLSNIKISTADKAIDLLFNNWLVYQVASSRFNGKCGYFQVGGAVGFRDQLQDCLTLIYNQPQLVRAHILDCAQHQYIDGDVMHWWHAPRLGVRTHISDDKLFLVLLACEYVAQTGDRSILSEKIPYLVSEPLNDLQESRMEVPDVTDSVESLTQHMCKAIASACQYGKHGLLLIGGGDWNDALNAIGLQKKGESVWLTMFAVFVIEKFVDLLDMDDRAEYLRQIARLKKSLAQCKRNDYYIRAITDHGELLGDIDSKFVQIDLLTQSWATFANIGDKNSQKKALEKAKILVDEQEGIIKLLAPPCEKSKYYGYISAYPKGVRENGGQYTHASVWFLKAVANSGDEEYANSLLSMLNPIKRCRDVEKNKRYKGEPYVLAGDIYSNADNYGRAGWTWYSGSASWLYVTILNDMLGISVRNNALCFKRPILDKWRFAKVEYKYKNSIINIAFDQGEKSCLEINGVKYFGEMRLPLKENIPVINVRAIFQID